MKYVDQYTKEISFPLGGIGTGCIGLGGDGRLIDWEIFNRPSKGSVNRLSHFAIRAIQNNKITAAVLNGDLQKELISFAELFFAKKSSSFASRIVKFRLERSNHLKFHG